jgi:uncharacterized caspase-like protein
MKFHVFFLILIIFLTYGCATRKFETKFDAEVPQVARYIQDKLEDKEIPYTKDAVNNGTIQFESVNYDPELSIIISESKRRKDKVNVLMTAKSKYPVVSDDPYKLIRNIVDDISLRLREEGHTYVERPEDTAPVILTQQDTIPPDIIIMSHDVTRGIQIVKKEETLVAGRVTDNSDIREVLLNNERIFLDEYGNFSKKMHLSSGNNTIRITATDINNNRASKEFVIQKKIAAVPPTPSGDLKNIPNWYTNQYAFVIGIDNYKNPNIPPLQNAVSDAHALSDMFREMGFHVFEVYNQDATKDNIMSKLKYIQRIVNKRDSFIMYFAGHGQGLALETGKRTGYIIPFDADIDLSTESIIDYESEAIPLETMKKITEAMSSKHVALLLDSCFSGLVMKRSIPPRRELTLEHYMDFLDKKAVNILTAGDDQPVSDGTGHSPFTRAILEGLKEKDIDVYDRDGYVTIDELYLYVKDKVKKSTNDRQNPQFDNLVGGNGKFIFKVR